ncbi:hypothetical protein L195_g051535 [Trifolium pratense]|uniref:Uncharacterized protein n=1 Tax=Trifolium pratense TaxID=57577 RepID=A0A2K3K089_TRIPR|nr:hypothetical protein L195_g051535 [Trifolium pratense]
MLLLRIRNFQYDQKHQNKKLTPPSILKNSINSPPPPPDVDLPPSPAAVV